MKLKSYFGGSLILFAAIAVTGSPCVAEEHKATIEMKNSSGKSLGKLNVVETAGGVRIRGNLSSLPPGTRGIHIHEAGKCEGPDFKSAGGHFNPDNKKHGDQNPEGPHSGDLNNITVGSGGKASVDVTAKTATMKAGSSSLFRDGGTALVIHATEDDRRTDPSGNAGDRIACGVIQH